MNLSALLALCEKAETEGHYAFQRAMEPKVVAALARCVECADILRGDGYEPRPGVTRVATYDNARAALSAALGES